MIEIRFTRGGWDDLSRLAPDAKIDVIHKLQLVEQSGLRGELAIGTISSDVSIYLLYSGHHHIAVAYDARANPPGCLVVAIEPYALIDLARKAALLTTAVRETGVGTRLVVF